MTLEEKLIVSAYTGYLMVEDVSAYHKFIEEKVGHPILTHELSNKKVMEKIQNAVKDDFIKLCKSEDENK